MIGILRGEGKFMTEEKNLQQMIEEDLEQCEIVWTQFYDNKESMEALFLMLISHYIDRINGFAENRSEERRVGKECRSRCSPYH